MMNELNLYKAMIDNGIQCSFDMKDPGKQQEDIDWFYTRHYEEMYHMCYGVSGDGLRRYLEPLWENIELYPDNAPKYKSIFQEMSEASKQSMYAKKRGQKIQQPEDHDWERTRDAGGRFCNDN